MINNNIKIEWRDSSSIRPYEKNAKKHPKKQVEQIADSIREFGFNQPIVLDKEGVIIVGHGRYRAAVELLKMEQVPTITVDIDEERAKAYRLADNKLNESDWDMELVVAELKELSLPMLDLTGFDRDLVLEPAGEDNEVPPVPKTPRSQRGDLYILGQHRVFCGDATLSEDWAALMDGEKADVVFTDPPYNVDYTGKTKDKLKIQNDKKSNEEFYQFLLAAFSHIALNTKRGGSAYIAHADSEGYNFRRAFQEAGFMLKQCIIWNKNAFVLGRQDYQWKHEPILYGWQEGEAHSWYGGRGEVTVWDIPRPSRSAEHPTMKPVELIMRAISNSSKHEDLVLDPFLGSGSTIIACEKSDRTGYGFELDPVFVDVVVQRWVDYTGRTEIIKNGVPEIWERSNKAVMNSVEGVDVGQVSE